MPDVAFEYFEIRPCIETVSGVESYLTEEEYQAEQQKLLPNVDKLGGAFRAFWTVYGRYQDDAGQFLALAIGDFEEKDAAFTVLNAILAPLAQARNELLDAAEKFDFDDKAKRRACLTAVRDVANDLTDVIAQSSDRERL